MSFLRPHLDAYAATIQTFDPLDRIHTVGASDVGQCERKVYWTKMLGDPDFGASQDEDYKETYGATLRGSMMESYFLAPAIKMNFGERFLLGGAEQKTFVSGFLSATPDGMLTDLTQEERVKIAPNCGTEAMVEFKTVDPRTNLSEPKAENVFQTHVQMGLVRELTPYKPTHSILSYTDASWWNEGPEFVIEFDPQVFEVAKARARRIMTAKSATDLQPEGWIGGAKDCEYCPFTKACGVQRKRVPDADLLKTFDPAFLEEVTTLAREIKQLDSQADEASELLRAKQEQMKLLLRNHQARKVPGIVSWSAVKGRAGWDNKAIREAAVEAGVDISAYATEGEPSDRLQITLKG